MAWRVPDFLEVIVFSADAQAFLRIHGTRILALSNAEKNLLELVHTGISKQQRLVARGNERCTWDDGMPLLAEVC